LRSAHIVATTALIAGCGTSSHGRDEIDGKVVADRIDSVAPVRVAYGAHWASGGQALVDKSGAFSLPRGARVAVAYVDTNRNGEFDRFAEPSGSCNSSATGWSCRISLQKTTLYRAITVRGDLQNDKTFVFWEDFGADGSSVAGSKVCIDQRCTVMDKPPFLTVSEAPVRVFSICGADGFQPQDATIDRNDGKSTVHIAQPPVLQPDIKVEHKDGLRVRLASHFDRLLIWGGDVDKESGDVRRVYWTSERANVHVESSADGMIVNVPERLLGACGKRPCDVVLQLLKISSQPDDPVVSETEYRTTVR
jgi:hypothetical protein